MKPNKATVVAVLGSTQTLAWGSSYYLPAILGGPIAAGVGLSTRVFFGVFSVSLLLGAAIAPYIGVLIDRHGGRAVLTASSVIIAAGLALLGLAQGIIGLTAAWL